MLNKVNQKDNLKENIFQKDLAKMLKAKRIEQGKSLEEVAKGICSTSYLSRIENNHVRIQEPYLQLLFEKLQINYNELKTSRNINYCIDFLKKKLLRMEQSYYDMLNKMINSNNYLDIEQQLILLYDDILNKKYNECELLMEKIDRCQLQLSFLEQQFYQYLISLYYYSTNQNIMAYRQLKNIIFENISDETLYWVLYELYICILYEIGKYNTYLKNANCFISKSSNNFFLNHKIKHHFMILSLEAKENYKQSINEITNYYEEQKMVDQNIIMYYNYYLAVAHLYNFEYLKAFKILRIMDKTPKIIQLLLICIINMNNEDVDSDVLNEITNYIVSEYEDMIKYLREYVILKNTRSLNILRMQTLLKTKILNQLKISYNEILYQEIIKEILILNIRCSKYKDGCVFIMNQLYDKKQNNIY